MNLNFTKLWTDKNRKLLSMLLIGIHFFVLFVIVWKTYPWTNGDSRRYLALAESLRNGNGYGLLTDNGFEPEGMRMPGYPTFILLGRIVGGNSAFAVICSQIVLYVASVWLVWRTTIKLFGEKSGFIFLALTAFYPFIMYSVGQISPEIPTVFLVALAVFLVLDLAVWRIAAATALLGISAYFRPNLIFLTIVFFGSLLIANRRNWRKSLIVAAVAVLIAAPFAVRNYAVFGKLTPIPFLKATGNSLMLATWSSRISFNSLIRYGMMDKYDITDEVKQSGMLEQIGEINRRVGVPEETNFLSMEAYPNNEAKMQADELLRQGAYRNIREDPIGYIKVVMSNAARMWFTSQLPDNYPSPLKAVLVAEGVLAALLGLIGLIIALRNREERNNFIVLLLCGVLLYFVITLSWSHTEARYTISARLFVLMFAAKAVYELGKLGVDRFWLMAKG